MPIDQYVDSPRKTRIFDASNLAASTIDSNILNHKPIHAMATKHQKTKSSKKVKQKGTRAAKRKRSQNYADGVTSEDENSDDIDYDDSDNNAAVAGADEADSIGEADDIAGGISALEGVNQVRMRQYCFFRSFHPLTWHRITINVILDFLYFQRYRSLNRMK